MRRVMHLIALVVLLTVNFSTPISYAREEKDIVEREKGEDVDAIAEEDGVVVTLIKDVNHPEEKELVKIWDKWFDYMFYSRRQVQDWVEFADWYDNADFQWEPFDYNNIRQNVTLYAKWTKKIAYQNWVVKLSNWKKSILVKSVNEWWDMSDVNKFKRIMNLESDKNYCHYEEECYSDQRSCYTIFVCTLDFFTEVSNILWKTVENLQQVDEYFTSIYGRYYFRWNNWYVEYNELISVENWFNSEISIDQSAQDRWFLNYSKILQPDTWWRENDISNNPCDATKWEYLPTLEDWNELIDMWNGINWLYRKNIMDLEMSVKTGLVLDTKKRLNNIESIQVLEPLIFQQDFLIPKAWSIEYEDSNGGVKFGYYRYPSLLWTSMSNEWSLWWFDVEKWVLYWGDVDNSAHSVRCFVVENPVIVEFNTNGWSNVESYKVAEWKTITAPDIPVKKWYTFVWWYKDSNLTQQWNFDKDVVGWSTVTLYAKWRVCGEWFAVKDNVCIPNDMDKEWVIMVTDWVNTMFIKDRNVWAESKCSSELYELIELSERRCPTFIWPILRGETIWRGEEHKTPLKWLDSTCISDEDFFIQVNDIVKNVEINTDVEFNNYINLNMQKCAWNYYFRWNNVGVNYEWLEIDNSDKTNFITNSNELFENWFNWWKLWTEEWSWWEQWNISNPCDATKWEYLPTPDDWAALMTIWWKNNGYIVDGFINDDGFEVIDDPIVEPIYEEEKEEVSNESVLVESKDAWSVEMVNVGWYQGFSDIEANNKFQRDMLIPNPWRILHNCEVEGQSNRGIKWNCIDKMYYEFWDWLWSAQNINGYVWIFSKWGIWYDIFGSLNNSFGRELNDIAVPVRCFVNMSESLVVTLISDGKIDREISVKKWDVIKEPKASLKSDAVFEWWYTESGEKYDFSTPITEDIKLYARWISDKWDGYSGWWGGKWSSSGGSDISKSEKNIKNLDIDSKEWNVNNSLSLLLDSSYASSDNVTKQTINVKNNTSVNWDKFSQEYKEAYNFAYQNWITSKSSIEDAKMFSYLTRIQMAKMLSNYAINVLWREPDLFKWVVKFDDVSNKIDRQYDNAVTLSYQLWIMWQNMPNNRFRPNDIVTRAEFVAAFSRMLYWTLDGKYVSTRKYYTNHMQKLEKEWIITNTNPDMTEKRWYVMIMLMRSIE